MAENRERTPGFDLGEPTEKRAKEEYLDMQQMIAEDVANGTMTPEEAERAKYASADVYDLKGDALNGIIKKV